MSFSTLLDKLVTGEWRTERLLARERYELAKRHAPQRMQFYAGAQPGVNRPSPNQLSTPEDYLPSYQRINLIRSARDMEEDHPFFDAILRDFETYVVGELKYTPATGNPEADKLIAGFLEWKFDQVDYTERKDLCALAKLAVRSMKRDGEMGSVFREEGPDIKLQFIEGDCIGDPMKGTTLDPLNFGGIIVNARGAPVRYQIFKRQPKFNNYTLDAEIPAQNFKHYLNPFRISQYHGVTVFKSAVEHGADMKQILDFTKLNIKWRASQLPYVTNEQGKPRGTGYEAVPASFNGTPQPLSIRTDGVTQTFMKLDEGVMEYPNDFPNSQFQNIMTELKRECAVGSGLPLEFVYRSEAGGVVQRFYVEKAEATFRADRQLLARTILNPIKNRIIQAGIDSGELALGRFGILATDIARFTGTWQMGRSVPVDYSRETDADIKQLDAGLVSPYDLANDAGRDLGVILEERKKYTRNLFAAAQEVADEMKRPFDEVLPYLAKIFPNPAPVAQTPSGTVPGSAEEPAVTPDPAAEELRVSGPHTLLALSALSQQVAAIAAKHQEMERTILDRATKSESMISTLGMKLEKQAIDQQSIKATPGMRRRQNGTVFEFDGLHWNAVT